MIGVVRPTLRSLGTLRASILVLCLAVAPTVHPQPPRPSAGIDVDETRSVALAATPASPCISLTSAEAVVVVARAAIDALAAATPARWTTEEERLALIAGKRAKGVLDKLSAAPDASGCVALPAPADGEALTLLLAMLERGDATVVDRRSGRAVASVDIRYLGMRCGPRCGRGTITVALPDRGPMFMRVDWWVS